MPRGANNARYPKRLNNLEKRTAQKYIFINNKPTAVLISIEDFETRFKKPMLIELSKDEVTPALKTKIEKSKIIPESELQNI